MAIEDEIINISDIDVGTEILNNDKIIVETNNGTRLLAFKDFVIGEENITFADKLVQGVDPTTGESSTVYSTVTGYPILTSNTTPGHVTTYNDVSGSIELGKFNYDGITKFAALSATIKENQSAINDLNVNIATLLSKLEATDSTALNSIELTTKAVNFSVSNTNHTQVGSSNAAVFDTVDLDPTTTNSAVTFTHTPKFSITYPSDSSFAAGWFIFTADIAVSSLQAGTSMILYVTSNGAIAPKATAKVPTSDGTGGIVNVSIQKFIYIKKGDIVTLAFSKMIQLRKGSTFAGINIQS